MWCSGLRLGSQHQCSSHIIRNSVDHIEDQPHSWEGRVRHRIRRWMVITDVLAMAGARSRAREAGSRLTLGQIQMK